MLLDAELQSLVNTPKKLVLESIYGGMKVLGSLTVKEELEKTLVRETLKKDFSKKK